MTGNTPDASGASDVPSHSNVPGAAASPQVSVVVVVYNDALHLEEAVRSVLGQGESVAEIVVVDDASTDGTPELLARLAAAEPRLRVITRSTNSGGCGTPRNEGLAAAGETYVMLLDSDDILPPDAVRTLLAAALASGADVAAGVCVRRELPAGVDTPWQRDLFPELGAPAQLYVGIAGRPGFLRDTLSVNKLYARAFLEKHQVRFAEGAVHYEDFVFTGRLYAARPTLVTIGDTVYLWHVRRDAGRQSISLRRDEVRNWQDRVEAHTEVLRILAEAGSPDLVQAACVKWLDYDLRMYVRELRHKPAEYRAQWWHITRAHLAGFSQESLAAATPASRWISELLLACPEPVELRSLGELAADRPRLIPPYESAPDGTPVLGSPMPGADHVPVPLTGLAELPSAQLPVAVDGTVTLGRQCEVRIRLHDVYGLVAAASPQVAQLELRARLGPPLTVRREFALVPDGSGWIGTTRVDAFELQDAGEMTAWAVRAVVVFEDGSRVVTAVRSPEGAKQRMVVFRPPVRFALVQAYSTGNGELALRVADGVRGGWEIVRSRVRRVLAKAGRG